MHITETARANLDRLLPGHCSNLCNTDPELVEIFDNFAFDEIRRYGDLDERTRLRVTLASLVACRAEGEYRVMLRAALAGGVTPIEAKGIVYHAVAYVGMGRAYDFINITNEVLRDHAVDLPLPGQATTTREDRFDRGLAVQKEIFGETIDRMREEAPEDEKHIQDCLSANCFGDYYTRTGLDVPMRELITFAVILSLGGCEPQFKGHVQGNLNVGNDRAMLIAVVTQLLPYVGYPRTLSALRCIDEVTSE